MNEKRFNIDFDGHQYFLVIDENNERCLARLDTRMDATDAILDDIVAMKDNMQTTQDGLKAAQEAKSIYDENRGSMKADADAAISSIESMASYLEVINNELEVQEDDYTEVMERIDAINKTDRRRASYYNFYTGNKWGRFEHYDLIVNSSTLGIDGSAHMIASCARELMAED